jgi:predicted metal-binding protein
MKSASGMKSGPIRRVACLPHSERTCQAGFLRPACNVYFLSKTSGPPKLIGELAKQAGLYARKPLGRPKNSGSVIVSALAGMLEKNG